jgi:hypothetical protein
MTSEATQSKSAQHNPYQFCSIVSSQTGTLAELVKCLDAEVEKKNGEAITPRALKRTLDFLKNSIGVGIASSDEPLPMSVLKTIRLLFLTDRNSARNLFQLLSPPHADDKSTMEFSTATTIPRDKEASKLIEGLIDTLALEIDPVRAQMFSNLLGDREAHSVTEKLLLHSERTNEEVSATLREGLCGDETLLALAFNHMARLMDQFRVKQKEDFNTPANEEMYTYLQTLPFRHYIQHFPNHLGNTRIQLDIGDIRNDAEHLCRLTRHHAPSSCVFSVDNFHHLLLAWPDEVCDLVSKATGIDTTFSQLKGHLIRAKALLISYAYRSFDCTDPNAPVLTVYDIVAALASFRYQQAEGEEYKPYWHGQTAQGSDPQRLFDKGLRSKDPHQHQGVAHIYLNRFYEYQAAFEGTTVSHHSWMQYQIATLRAYQSVLELKDTVKISMALMALNFYCVGAAKDYVIEHLTTSA